MRYSEFTLDIIEEKLGVKNKVESLFLNVKSINPSQKLKEDLAEADGLALRSEKAKSEWIVVPILKEIRRNNENSFKIYSGDNLNVDKEKGLVGECDFILTLDTKSFNINYPIIQIVEAKKNDVELGIPQCAAQMIGAKLFNEKKGVNIPFIYGCVTTGDEWLFMKYENDILIDQKKYYLSELSDLLGIFQQIIGIYKEVLN
jgi:hypothetical protein